MSNFGKKLGDLPTLEIPERVGDLETDLSALQTIGSALQTTVNNHISDTDIHFTVDEARKVVITSKSSAFTLSLSEGDYYRYTGSSDANVTVPPNSAQAYDIGAVITIIQTDEGVITAVEGSGVTINFESSTAGEGKAIQLVKVGTNTWDCIGGVS